MLNGKLALWNCKDVEALCSRVLNQAGGSDLPWHKREEALAWLIASCWELSLDYRPELNESGTQGFAGWAARTLRRRYVDWVRDDYRTTWKFKDSSYERERPELLSLDAAAGSGDGTARLADVLPVRGSVPDPDRIPDPAWVDRERNRRRSEHKRVLSQAAQDPIAA